MEEEMIQDMPEDENEMEEVTVDTLEFNLDDEDIEELISKLQTLKETKMFTFDADDTNELQMNYSEPSDDDDDDEEENEEGEFDDDDEELSDDEESDDGEVENRQVLEGEN